MSTIDTTALDEAVRRFPALLSLCRTTNPLCVIAWPFDVMEAIVREYRLVLAERSKGRGV